MEIDEPAEDENPVDLRIDPIAAKKLSKRLPCPSEVATYGLNGTRTCARPVEHLRNTRVLGHGA